jgi:hypothetical protein
MSDFGWIVFENIIALLLFTAILFLADGNWRWFCIAPLMFINLYGKRKV